MLYLVVYPWSLSNASVKYVSVITDSPGKFTDAIFSGKFSKSSEEEVTELARAEARKRGIAFVRGLDKAPSK
ncbi:MAG TPA: hypothetical protein PK333_03170 [Candidatus Moranbacteria bacterium]|nr:hypothetical protein [Candidatus Moranbacteria bacterium]